MNKSTEKSIKVSVIVLISHSNFFLRKCLDSILEQSLDDIEIVCVDQSGTSETSYFLREYEKKDSRINVLKTESESVNHVLVKAIATASGEYIHFLESCDYVLPYAYEALYNKIKKFDLDMIRCSCLDYDLNQKEFLDIPESSLSCLRPGDFNRCVSTEEGSPLYKVSTALRGGIYRKSFIIENSIQLDWENCCCDRVFYYAAITNANSIMISCDRLVVHRMEDSAGFIVSRPQDFSAVLQSAEQIAGRLQQDEVSDEVQEHILLREFDEMFAAFLKFRGDSVYGGEIQAQTERFVNEYNGAFAHALRSKYRDVIKTGTGKLSKSGYNKIHPFHEICQNPKVSVVVPTYNVEDYLNEALHSLTTQTLQDMEFICINDGSADGSLTILKEYAAVDRRFHILDGPNGGYGKGMNRGFDAASGEYLGILEPDDFVPAEMFQELYTIAKAQDLDFIKSDFRPFSVNADGSLNIRVVHLATDRSFYNRVIRPLDEPETFKFAVNTWSGIYKLDFIRRWDIRHNETPGASYQDNGFWFQTFCRADRAYFRDKPYYNYRQDNPNASMNSTGKMYAVTEEYRLIRERFEKDAEFWSEAEKIYWTKKLGSFFVTLYRISNEMQPEYIQHLYEEFKEPYEKGIISEDFLIGNVNWDRFTAIMENPNQYLSKICVSVIIPVYNSEKWIGTTLDSLLVHNEVPFEIICVNDGSTDDTLSVLRQYEEKDPRVRVISQENGGAGAARNAGLELARGEYLSFLDADDFFESNMLRSAYDRAKTLDADIVVFRSDRYWESTGRYTNMNFTINRELLPKEEPFAGRDIQYNVFRAFSGYAWDKLFRADFVRKNKLKFLEQPCINDQLFTFCAVLKADRIATINTVLAHYRRPEGALTFARDEGTKWRCYYDSLIAMRGLMQQWGIFEEREQDFINYSLYFSLWNITTLHAPAYYELYDKLKNEWFDELGVTAHGMDYFYNRGDWNQLQMMHELTAEEFLFWRNENLNSIISSKSREVAHAYSKVSAERGNSDKLNWLLSGFVTARVDLKNEGSPHNDLLLLEKGGHNVREEKPDWFADQTGVGLVIRADSDIRSGHFSFTIKCIGNGTLSIKLKAMHMAGSDGNRIPYWMDYTSYKVNGNEMLREAVCVCHDIPYEYRKEVKDGEVVVVSCDFKSHAVDHFVTEQKINSKPQRILTYTMEEGISGFSSDLSGRSLTELLKTKTVISWGGYQYFQDNINRIKDRVTISHVIGHDPGYDYTGFAIIQKEDIPELKDPFVLISQYNKQDILPAAKWLTEHNIPFAHLSFVLDESKYDGRFLQGLGEGYQDINGNRISISPEAGENIIIDVREAANADVLIGEVVIKEGLYVKLTGNKPRFHIGDRTFITDMRAAVHDCGAVEIGDDCLFMGKVSLTHQDACMLFDAKTGKRLQDFNPVKLGNHIYIGEDAEFYGGADVGDHCVISAGSVLAEKFPANVMIAGNPAKIIQKDVLWSRDALADPSITDVKNSRDQVTLGYLD